MEEKLEKSCEFFRNGTCKNPTDIPNPDLIGKECYYLPYYPECANCPRHKARTKLTQQKQ